MLYLVTYTLRPKRDATMLISELQKTHRWWHFLDDTWVLATSESRQELWRRVAPKFIKSDRVLIVEFRPESGYHGWLPQEAWDWIVEHRYW